MSDEKNSLPSSDLGVSQEPSHSLSGALGDLLKLFFGPSANEVGLMMAENIRSWRYRQKNAEKISEKIQDELGKRNLTSEDLSPIPEGDGFRLLEASCMEEDETVQTLWARLAANAMDPSKNIKVTKAYIDLLKSIGPVEAAFLIILQKINRPLLQVLKETQPNMKIAMETASKHRLSVNKEAEEIFRIYPFEERSAAIQNLIRLRCITIRNKRQLQQTKTFPGVRGLDGIQIDARNLVAALDHLEKLALLSLGSKEISIYEASISGKLDLPEAEYDFTHLGQSLMEACTHSDPVSKNNIE